MKYLIIILFAILLFSCSETTDTKPEKKMTVYCYAEADSTFDRLSLTRNADFNELITQEVLGISGAEIKLFENETEIGLLKESEVENGIYFLDNQEFKFVAGNEYELKVTHPDFPYVSARTVCPFPLDDIIAKDVSSNSILESYEDNPLAVDTLEYYPSIEVSEDPLLFFNFDESSLDKNNGIAMIKYIPLDRDSINFLEHFDDFDDLDISVRAFKWEELYGKDNYNFFISYVKTWWYEFYCAKDHFIVLSATDEAYANYIESSHNGNNLDVYTNVENGKGLFTIKNSTGAKNRYRVYIKDMKTDD
ncbi:MAG: DUF4249 family protein [Candidatus Delongbacteria bacterium]|nr:DUF4249 family protein [Candidatus Delongbacteria bacterium]MBN2836279.1 DUF4249 family protein [Candidatus Delongbacteria bacterium]